MIATLVAATLLAAGPQQVCGITDKRLSEISGLAATATGYVVVNDGSDDADRRRIFFLDRDCEVSRTVKYPSRPRDTEDLAVGPDGTVWVADIGDNSRTRTTIALWRLEPGGRKPELIRMAYPDGAHDAEAMLSTPGGTPIIVTKTAGSAGVYVPDGLLSTGKTTTLRLAGSVSLPSTATSNPFGLPGRMVITGGAVSPDGRRAVLRTYADAFEFDVPDGDVVEAITKGKPRETPLPDEPQGESIAYSPDGTSLLTVSEVNQPPANVLRYPLIVPSPPASPAPVAVVAPPDRSPRFPAGALFTGGVLLLAAAALAVGLILRRRR
ncbi:hypothetical protein [Paractinoplanes rishiriensis]|uniref:Esterase-like activity of phytase family protein n=1 Tax=Paractinoplanes rishiriensis TaxID=1050105 RepID=A0A919N2B9_9ACTN|nr:hypothetical protein [Actinoplanes rishiriensis]GIE99322.1 hypothetical protein Ari01nite_67870 [Actinoplanes rishiriensis]